MPMRGFVVLMLVIVIEFVHSARTGIRPTKKMKMKMKRKSGMR
jgi:hypothetical protein